MAIAWKRSMRQLISGAIAVVAAYAMWQYSISARLFNAFQGGNTIWPLVAAVVTFFLAFYVAMTVLKSKAAK